MREGLIDDTGYHGLDECSNWETCNEEAYKQGRADAIDECIAILKEDWKWVNKNSAIAMHLILEYERRLEQLKEQNNE